MQAWTGSRTVRVGTGKLFKEGNLNSFNLVTEFHSRAELQLKMFLYCRQRQQHQ